MLYFQLSERRLKFFCVESIRGRLCLDVSSVLLLGRRADSQMGISDKVCREVALLSIISFHEWMINVHFQLTGYTYLSQL